MGFGFHITTVYPGPENDMCYSNHLEACYCIEGGGTITDKATGQTWKLEPGVLYALDKHDRHRVVADSKLVLACVFNPPLSGKEVHDDTGAFPAAQG